MATLAHLRNKLRSGDVWLDRSAEYRRFDTYLLPQRAAAPIVAELGLPPTADEWLERRGRELDMRLKRFAAGLREGAYEGVRLVGRRLSKECASWVSTRRKKNRALISMDTSEG